MTIAERAASGVREKVGHAGGPSRMAKDALKKSLPFGGGSKNESNQQRDDNMPGGSDNVQGIGDGRRMPVQQRIDIAMPLERVYNQWTQFEDWPSFMHRVTRVTQEDPCTISVATKIWGKTKEFTAEIVTQRPEDCVKWRVTSGITHEGVVFFRELGPDLTRVELSLDVQPGSLAEKFARGTRLVKRAVRGDLHRFKAYVEMLDEDIDGWRGTIEDGKVVRKRESRRSGGKRSGSKSERSRSNGQHARSSGQRSRSSSSTSRASASRSRSRSA